MYAVKNTTYGQNITYAECNSLHIAQVLAAAVSREEENHNEVISIYDTANGEFQNGFRNGEPSMKHNYLELTESERKAYKAWDETKGFKAKDDLWAKGMRMGVDFDIVKGNMRDSWLPNEAERLDCYSAL